MYVGLSVSSILHISLSPITVPHKYQCARPKQQLPDFSYYSQPTLALNWDQIRGVAPYQLATTSYPQDQAGKVSGPHHLASCYSEQVSLKSTQVGCHPQTKALFRAQVPYCLLYKWMGDKVMVSILRLTTTLP